MAATLPVSAAVLASPPLLSRHSYATPLASFFRRSRRWQGAAARRNGRGSSATGAAGIRWLPPAAADGDRRAARGVAFAAAAAVNAPYGGSNGQGSLRMVFLSTAVAVCGSFVFGTCVGYSAPIQAGIMNDIGLSNSQYGVFGSILTIGAMIGALTSGRLADTLGRKMTMRLAAVIGIFGWITIYVAKDAMCLCAGRVLLGYCTGVLSYVVLCLFLKLHQKMSEGVLQHLTSCSFVQDVQLFTLLVHFFHGALWF